jgi:MtfA peptidase
MNAPLEQHPSILPPAEEAFPQEWLPFLHDNVFLYSLLHESDQVRLRQLVPHFIAGKFWEGCGGLHISDEIRVTIAAQACLLVLGFDDYCFEDCKSILVYPGGYLGIVENPFSDENEFDARLGEAHHGGPVVLSWWHACWDGRHRGGKNLVLHEFAHKLAERGDPRTGIPPLDDPRDQPRWESVIGKEHEQLIEDAAYQRPTLLDPYGAKNPAEFFAVASECFFLQPVEMQRRHADLYQLLADWYCQDPAQWRSDAAIAARTWEAWEQYIRHAITECDTALRRYPDRLDAYWERADCYGLLGEYEKAQADYTHLLQVVPKAERANVYYSRGWMYRESGAFEESIADLSEAISRCPDFAAAHRERGTTHARQGEHDKALDDLTRALKLDPRDDAAYLERGRVWYDLGNYDRAVRDLTRSLRLCPHRVETLSQRAQAYLGRHQYDLALADCNEALRLDPSCIEAYIARAEAYAAQGDHERAQQDRDEAARREK